MKISEDSLNKFDKFNRRQSKMREILSKNRYNQTSLHIIDYKINIINLVKKYISNGGDWNAK